jgi:hypothetical protein
MIAVLAFATACATGCAMQAGSPDDRVGPDGQPLSAADDTTVAPEGSSTTPTTTGALIDCNSPDPQPWNCPSVHPNTNSGAKTQPHDVYGNAGSDTPSTPNTP